jgi:hypothetical protein
MTDERLTLIVETYTAEDKPEIFFEKSPWIQVAHAE